jgi:glutamate synthase domain-containing protein 3
VDGTFEKYRNYELTDYDTIEYDDEEVLREYITNHYNYTGSTRAKEILENWDNSLLKFIKIFPKEYQMALKNQAQKKKEDALIV